LHFLLFVFLFGSQKLVNRNAVRMWQSVFALSCGSHPSLPLSVYPVIADINGCAKAGLVVVELRDRDFESLPMHGCIWTYLCCTVQVKTLRRSSYLSRESHRMC